MANNDQGNKRFPNLSTNNKNNSDKKGPKFSMLYVLVAFGIMLIAYQIMNSASARTSTMSPQQFFAAYASNEIDNFEIVKNSEKVRVTIKKEFLKEAKYNNKHKDSLQIPKLLGDKVNEKGPHFTVEIGTLEEFEKALIEANKTVVNKPRYVYSRDTNYIPIILNFLGPFILLALIYILMMRKMASGGGGAGGGGIFSIGKSKAQLFEKGTKVNINFNDVAGLDEAKQEVMEIVDFLKHPKKYTALGGKIPKGALLVGPPGTGKTLLAKAMAGEAQVPFFSMSGSDFVEMFVGVGASRVRDLFKQAREKSPCVIFIDEIDAIGRARGKNQMMSNDERENTLNQLLVEMDGFGTDSGIIILAATNRPDVLDSALLRPGRFDRQISIDRPDLKGREAIFNVHLKSIKTSQTLDKQKLAEQTPGFAGADIANVCNEAALIAARKNKDAVDMSDFQDAIDRVIGGLEKKDKIIRPDEKRVIAYHEAGHAVAGWFLEHAHPLVKVTIVPRGTAALGYAQYLPKEKYLTLAQELEDDMAMTLGGRASEEIFFGKISTGALSDLQQVTRIAYSMVSVYGMNDKIGNISYYDPQNENGFTKPYSEETGRIIDEEVKKISDKAYERALSLLTEKKNDVVAVAEALLQKEVLFANDLEQLIGKRPFEDKKLFENESSTAETTTVTPETSIEGEAKAAEE